VKYESSKKIHYLKKKNRTGFIFKGGLEKGKTADLTKPGGRKPETNGIMEDVTWLPKQN